MADSLDILIVNWNSGTYLGRCLESLQVASGEGWNLARVVVVDNASADGSAEGLCYPGIPLTLIRNSENRGFAAACNQAAEGSRADYLLFLNPDVMLASDSVAVPLHFMHQPDNARVGICGIQLLDEQGKVSRTCSLFPTCYTLFTQILGLNKLFSGTFQGHFLEESAHRQLREVDQVMGAFLLIRRPLFEALGGFDEQFFVYFEDLDLSYRAYQMGWRSLYLATAQAYHKGGGCSERAMAVRLFYSLRSRIVYGYKHFGWMAATSLLLGTLLFEPLSRLAWAGWRGSYGEMRETVRAYTMLWRALPVLLFNGTTARRHQNAASQPLHPVTRP